jgi:HK97 family phage major capsid protein
MLQKLKQRQLEIVELQRTLLDKESISQEENETYVRLDSEYSDLTTKIARQEKLDATQETLRQVTEVPAVTEVPKTRAEDKKQEDAKRYTEAFENMIRTPMMNLDGETRAVLNTGTDAEGGYLVPEVYLTTVINKLLERNVMRQLGDIMQTSSTTNIPLGDGRPSFSLIAENGAYGTTDASFAQKQLGAYKLGGIIQSSDELIQDAFINLEQYLTNLIVEGVADAEEAYFTTGTGTAQPTGILTGGTLGKTTAATAAVTADEVLDLIYALKAVYRGMGATLVMNSQTELALRKLKDSQGQYLWQPSLQVGAPSTFAGFPIAINEKMPDIGTGNKFMAFGDFSYFKIGDRGGLSIKRLEELYAANGQIGWRVSKRFDSVVTQAEAIQYMANA